MAQSNHERVGKALEILNKGLKPFIEREMKAEYGDRWSQEALKSLREQHLTDDGDDIHLDTQGLLLIMWDQWNIVFRKVLGHAERSLVSELRETRNNWAHQKSFSGDDLYRVLDSTYRLLTSISSVEAQEIDRQRKEVLRLRYEDDVRRTTRQIAATPVQGQPSGGLRPWREVMTPHPDVASGHYRLAEFAANLGQVHRNEGEPEYRLPRDFFQRTFLTAGLRHLLTDALQRLTGTGGDPVIELQTNFGGGKTHSLLALYHLFSGAPISDLIGMEPVLGAVGISKLPHVQRAVLVGYELSPGQPQTKSDGTEIRTLWGELAWQLLGRDGFALVAEADRQGVSPGSNVLRQLFAAASPCLILIDELVAYIRQLYGKTELSGGSFDANLSFAQALTEAAKETPYTLVVATLPASDIEIGGEGGSEALARLRNVFGRLESSWRPANTEEGFEIVRRRLFQPITEAYQFASRDTVVKAFADLYRAQPQEFPPECHEADYERRIKDAYPLHPELFERLYKDWSSLEKFQRTRGVLRLMAAVIHSLWENQDKSLLILPAMLPLDADAVLSELTRYLDPTWVPVVESDVDGPNSLPLRLERENPNLARYSACRRVAHTILLGSAPTYNSANRGLEDTRIKLGCVQPGESVATFGDALRRLTDQATHLYQNDKRYWYSTQVSVSRLAQDRASQVDDDTVYLEIETRLKREEHNRGDFSRVHNCPTSTSDIPEDTAVRLVILKPQYTHALRDKESLARHEAARLLEMRGNTRRNNRNTLIFLAADRTRLEELKQRVRQHHAWKSIRDETETLNLDAFQRKQASDKYTEAETRVEALLPETFIWLLIPDQPDPKKTTNDLQELRMQPQPHIGLATAANRRLLSEEMLITRYAGTLLRNEMDKIPLWRGNHVPIKELEENFAKYIYLPRLKSTEVLLAAIRDGVQSSNWERETFAYADSWDEARNRYLGLRAGQPVIIAQASSAVLVKPEIAAAQMAADATPAQPAELTSSMTYGDSTARTNPIVIERNAGTNGIQEQTGATAVPTMQTLFPETTPAPLEAQLHRFHGSVNLNALRLSRDAATISEEVLKHLNSLPGAKVQVTLEIQAELPDGVPDSIVRTVSENCRTLRFETVGFEED